MRVAILSLSPWRGGGSFQPFDFGARRVHASLLNAGIEGLEARVFDGTVLDEDFGPLERQLRDFAPDLVGVSVFVWSFSILLGVVERLKAVRPNTTVVLGGPSARPAMFNLEPYRERRHAIDALVLGEGEDVFVQVAKLPEWTPATLGQVLGVAVPTADGFASPGKAPAIRDLDALPSPYVQGLVGRRASPHLETFRGCPLSCSFCEWGADADGSRIFSEEYLVRELEAIRAKGGASVAMLTDAALNLNNRAFKNLRAAEKRTGVLASIGLNFEVYPSHLTSEHLEFIADLQRQRAGRVGIGLQSFDREVLRKMNRPFDEKRFIRVAQLLADTRCDLQIEIIAGLPGDSPASFRSTLDRARGMGVDVRVFPCLVLPDALMTRAPDWADLKFQPDSLLMTSCAGWSERDVRESWEYLNVHANRDNFGTPSATRPDAPAMSWVFKGEVNAHGRASYGVQEPPAPAEDLPRTLDRERLVALRRN